MCLNYQNDKLFTKEFLDYLTKYICDYKYCFLYMSDKIVFTNNYSDTGDKIDITNLHEYIVNFNMNFSYGMRPTAFGIGFAEKCYGMGQIYSLKFLDNTIMVNYVGIITLWNYIDYGNTYCLYVHIPTLYSDKYTTNINNISDCESKINEIDYFVDDITYIEFTYNLDTKFKYIYKINETNPLVKSSYKK
jgi:hypothetical protein